MKLHSKKVDINPCFWVFFMAKYDEAKHLSACEVFANGLDLGVRLQHFSNGGIKQPNGGVNFAVARVAYKF